MEDSKYYKLFRWIVPVGIVLIFVLIELIVRIFVPANKSSEVDLGPLTMFEKLEKQDGTWYRITGEASTTNRNFEFKEKPDDGVFRVVVLGGSAAAGWPHPSNQTFSAYLEKALNGINGNKRTEVINCAAHGFASYRVLQVFRQVKKWHPNLVVVWSGNNEFLEERGVDDNPFSQFLRQVGLQIRTVQVINKAFFTPAKLGSDVKVAGTFWKKTRQESLALRTDDKKFASVRRIYSNSIGEIVREAKDEKIQVMLMTVPVNLRDWQPNVSVLKGSADDSLTWRQHYIAGRGMMIQQEAGNAISELKLAAGLQPEHADTWFWLARAYEQAGDSVSAYNCYNKARDFDMNPFRALSAFNDSIRNLSKRYEVPLFDAEKSLRRYAKNGIPGFDMFIDYVHPTKKGNVVLCLNAASLISTLPQFDMKTRMAVFPPEVLRSFQDDYFDESDFNVQIKRFSLCCITHQSHSVVLFGNSLLQTAPPDAANNKETESTFEKIKAGVDAFRSKIETDSIEYVTGKVSPDQRVVATKKIDAFFDTYYPYGTY